LIPLAGICEIICSRISEGRGWSARLGDKASRDSIAAVLVRRRFAWVSACWVSASICARRRKRSCKSWISPYRPGLMLVSSGEISDSYPRPKSTMWFAPSYSMMAGIACPLSSLMFSSVTSRIVIDKFLSSTTNGVFLHADPAFSAIRLRSCGSPGQRTMYVASVNKTSRADCWNLSGGRCVIRGINRSTSSSKTTSCWSEGLQTGFPQRNDSRCSKTGHTGHSVDYKSSQRRSEGLCALNTRTITTWSARNSGGEKLCPWCQRVNGGYIRWCQSLFLVDLHYPWRPDAVAWAEERDLEWLPILPYRWVASAIGTKMYETSI